MSNEYKDWIIDHELEIQNFINKYCISCTLHDDNEQLIGEDCPHYEICVEKRGY